MWQCGLGSLRALQARGGCAGKGRGQPPGKGTVGGPQLCFLPTAGEGNSCREGPTGVSRAGVGCSRAEGSQAAGGLRPQAVTQADWPPGAGTGWNRGHAEPSPAGCRRCPLSVSGSGRQTFGGLSVFRREGVLTTRCAERVAEGVGDLGSPLTQHRSPKVPSRGPWDLRGPSEQRPPLNSLTWLTAGASRWPAGAAGGTPPRPPGRPAGPTGPGLGAPRRVCPTRGRCPPHSLLSVRGSVPWVRDRPWAHTRLASSPCSRCGRGRPERADAAPLRPSRRSQRPVHVERPPRPERARLGSGCARGHSPASLCPDQKWRNDIFLSMLCRPPPLSRNHI